MASDDYVARGGCAASASSPNWSRPTSSRSLTSWLPPPSTPLFKGGPPMSPDYWRFLQEISTRLDGIRGMSIAEVNATVAATQTVVLEAQTAALQAQATANAVSTSVDVIREVAITNGLSGADQIP